MSSLKPILGMSDAVFTIVGRMVVDAVLQFFGVITPGKVKGSGIKKIGRALSVRQIQDFIKASTANVNQLHKYVKDTQLSDTWTQVYWNDEMNKGIIFNRQTEDLRDVWSDVKAALNIFKSDKRFKNGWRVMNEARNKYGGLDKFEGIGYSLGAMVLEHYKYANEFSHIYFISKPVLPIDIYNGLKPLKNATEIRSKLDPVNLLKPWQDEANESILITGKTVNPLKEHKQQEILGRLDPDMVVGSGININKLKVAELKLMIKQLRHGDAKRYPISGKSKKELVIMANQLHKKK
jgi:hypothetical protein